MTSNSVAEGEYMKMMLAGMRVNRSVLEETQNRICALNKELMQAVIEGDLCSVLDLYNEEAELMSSGLPPCFGKAAIRTYYDAVLKARMRFLERCPFEVTNLAPLWAFERGYYRFEVRGQIHKGRYFVLWKHQGDGWHIIQECRNETDEVHDLNLNDNASKDS